MLSTEDFDIKFTSREVSAWGGLVLLKKMMDGMGVFGPFSLGGYLCRAPTGATIQLS